MSRTGEGTDHKYRYIYNDIRRDIVLGKYPTGSLLPSETVLMHMYSAGRNTVRHAVKLLRDNGLVSSQRGSGVTVLDTGHLYRLRDVNEKNGAPRRGLTVEYYDEDGNIDPDAVVVGSAPSVDTAPAPAKVAKAFCVDEGTEVYRLQRIWKIGGVPFMYMVQYFNKQFLFDVVDYMDDMVSSVYREMGRYGLHFIDAKETISCVNADFLTANLLRVELGAALLRTTRVARCEAGIFEYADILSVPKYTGYSSLVDAKTTLFKTPDKVNGPK